MSLFSKPRRDHQALQGEGRHAVGSAATTAEIDHGVPLFLDQLVAALRSGGTKLNTEISKSAVLART